MDQRGERAARGVLGSCDSNLRLSLWSSAEGAREGILSVWETADIIKISEKELSFLTKGEEPFDDAVVEKLFHPNLKLLLVTEGADGCRYYTKAMRLSAAFSIAGWLAVFFSRTYLSLDVGRFLTGYGIGVFSFVVPIFIAEIATKNLRGGLTALNQLMIVKGESAHDCYTFLKNI